METELKKATEPTSYLLEIQK